MTKRNRFLAFLILGATWACAPLEPPEQRQEEPYEGYYDDYDFYDDHDIHDREAFSDRDDEEEE